MVGIRPSLPVQGVSLILGNDLAGEKVMVNPSMSPNPQLNTGPVEIELDVPGVLPSCAITHAMAHRLKENKLNTYSRTQNYFYWSGIRKDVQQFCRSCHVCHLVGKPNQKVPVALLQPIPAVEEPFSRVIVDCVDPLPKTKARNQYLLTVMCALT